MPLFPTHRVRGISTQCLSYFCLFSSRVQLVTSDLCYPVFLPAEHSNPTYYLTFTFQCLSLATGHSSVWSYGEASSGRQTPCAAHAEYRLDQAIIVVSDLPCLFKTESFPFY